METMVKNELIVAETKGILSFVERDVVNLRRNLAVDNMTDLQHGLNRIHEILWAIEGKIEKFQNSETDEDEMI